MRLEPRLIYHILCAGLVGCSQHDGNGSGQDDGGDPDGSVIPEDFAGVRCPVPSPAFGDDPWADAPQPQEAPPVRGLVAIDVTADGQFAVIAGQKDQSATVLDLASPVASFVNLYSQHCIGKRPIQVRSFDAFTVIIAEHDTHLTLLDLSGTPFEIYTVAVPLYTQDVVWDASRQRYYVSNRASDSVLSFDAGWNPIGAVEGIAVGRYPGPMALGSDGRLYVGNRGTWDVSVIDVDAGVVVATVHLGSRPEAIAATAGSVVVTNHGGADLRRVNQVPVIDDDQADIANVLTEIVPAGSGFLTADLHEDRGADYAGVDTDPNTGLIAFTGAGGGTVHLGDVDSPGALDTIDVLADRWGLPGGRAPSGLRIFTNTRDVAIAAPDRVLAINFFRTTMVDLRRNDSGVFELVSELPLDQAGAPITAFQKSSGAVNFNRVQNGERYFNTLAAWKRDQQDFTCATCHSDGHTDLRMIFDRKPDPFDPSSPQAEERHPSARFSGNTLPLAWEGTIPTLVAFNRAALDAHDVPLPPDDTTPPDQRIHTDVASFMVDYEEVIVAGPNPFPAEAGRGSELFHGAAGCSSCHAGPYYSDGAMHEVGTGRTINTPTLLGLWDRAPYLHDGRAWALEDVLDSSIYTSVGDPHGNLALSEDDKAALVAFLRGL